MPQRTVTLYIDDTSLRLTVTQGRQVKEWAEAALEPGLVENNVVVKESEVGARIKQLFEVQNIKTKRISLGLSGIRCLTRPIILPKLPKEMLDEAVRREAQRVLPVALEELYLSWQAIPSKEDQTQVFMLGILRRTADGLFKALQPAGLKPGFMEIKPLLLARTVKETTAVLLDVQAADFDIVVMSDGVPQPVRSIRFASGALSSEEKLTTVTNELNRTLTFYNTNNPEKPLAASVPLLVSGEFANQPELHKALSGEIGHPVSPLMPPMECPDGMDASHYMANMGLALPAASAKESTGATVAAMNALPDRYRTRAVSLTNVLAVPGAAIVAGLLVFQVIFLQSTSGDIDSLNTRLKDSNQLLQQAQSQRDELSAKVEGLQNSLSQATTSGDNFAKVIDILEKQADTTGRDLAVAVDSLPQSLTLTSIHHIGDILTVTGRAPNEKQILSYLTKLEGSGQFGNIVITDMTRTKDGEIDFTVVGTLQTQMIGASALEVVLGSVPASVSITSIDSTEDTLTVEGVASNADKVFSYLRTLEASGKFTEITITSMTQTKEDETRFSLVLKTGKEGA